MTSLTSTDLLRTLQQQRASATLKQQNTIRAQFRPRLNSEKIIATRETGFQPATQDAVSNLENVISRLGTIRGYVWDLLDFKTRSQTVDAATIDTYAARFDTTIRSLNTVADEVVVPPNLIGSTFATDLSYIINSLGDRKSTSYVDLSTGYSIQDAVGNVWKKDSYANSGTLAQYTSTDVATGKKAEVSASIRLDSISGNLVDFTINPGTASEESFLGGTLSTTGLDVADSWLYASLSTTDGRARAEAALKSALTMIAIESAAFNGALARAKFDLGMAEIASAGATTNISSLNQARLLAMQEVSFTSNRESEASAIAVTRHQTLLQAYQYMFDSAIIGNKSNEMALSTNKTNDTTRTGGLLSIKA